MKQIFLQFGFFSLIHSPLFFQKREHHLPFLWKVPPAVFSSSHLFSPILVSAMGIQENVLGILCLHQSCYLPEVLRLLLCFSRFRIFYGSYSTNQKALLCR